jgi:hypothetical protein
MEAVTVDAVLCFATEFFRMVNQMLEKLGNSASGLVVDLGNFGAAVEILEQVSPQGREFLPSRLAERGETRRVTAEIIKGLDASLSEIRESLADEVIYQEVHQTPNHKSPIAWDVEIGVFHSGGIFGTFPQWHIIECGVSE